MKIKRSLMVVLFTVLIPLILTSCVQPERPLSAAELLNIGERYLLELNFEQALVHFTMLIDIEPMNPRGYLGAAESYTGLEQRQHATNILRQGLERTESIDIVWAWIELDPHNSQTYLDVADILVVFNNIETAIEVLRRGLEHTNSETIGNRLIELESLINLNIEPSTSEDYTDLIIADDDESQTAYNPTLTEAQLNFFIAARIAFDSNNPEIIRTFVYSVNWHEVFDDNTELDEFGNIYDGTGLWAAKRYINESLTFHIGIHDGVRNDWAVYGFDGGVSVRLDEAFH